MSFLNLLKKNFKNCIYNATNKDLTVDCVSHMLCVHKVLLIFILKKVNFVLKTANNFFVYFVSTV